MSKPSIPNFEQGLSQQSALKSTGESAMQTTAESATQPTSLDAARFNFYQLPAPTDFSPPNIEQNKYLSVPELQYPKVQDDKAKQSVSKLPTILDAARSIEELTENGTFQILTPADWSFNKSGIERKEPPTSIESKKPPTGFDANRFDGTFPEWRNSPSLDARINYYRFAGEDRHVLNTSVGLEKRERLTPGEAPTIKIVYEDTKKTLGEKGTTPDFRITADGAVQIVNNPETNPYKEIIIEVARGTGYIGLPSDAQQKALSTLTEYLSNRITGTYLKDSSDRVSLEDKQGLLPQEAESQINPAPQPESALPPSTQSQTEALNRMSGSDSGSMSPSQANDYFPPSEVPPLPDETPNLSALKDLVAGFSTRGIPEPYTAVQDRGARGFGVGRYALTADNIFDWLSNLSDEELSELEEMEITTADGKKKKIKLPKSTGAKLKKMRDLLKAVKQGKEGSESKNGQSGSDFDEDAESAEGSGADKALYQLVNDPEVKDFTQLLSKMQGGKEKPTTAEITSSLSPELQEVIATDLIYKFAKDSADPKTNKINIGQVVLAMQIGHTPSVEEKQNPANVSLMSAAERGYPLALQHTQQPDQPVTWNEKSGKVVGDPNSYFFSQFRNETYNPNGPARSNNCGPASLAMAAKAFHKEGNVVDPEKQIDRARIAMTGRNNDNELTNLSQIANGAKKLGLQTDNVSDINSLNRALDTGKQIVLFGNPAAYGNRFSKSQYSHYNGLHFILVAGKTSDENGKVTYAINDPLSRKGTMTVSSTELQKYMRKENSGRTGVAVWT